MDNCSAHVIPTKHFPNVETVYLPPMMTCTLQPTDTSLGRSVKAAYRTHLVSHLLKYVDRLVEAGGKEKFSMTKAVDVLVAVKMVAQAWNCVPKTVVLNEWRKRGILAPYQQTELHDKLAQFKNATGRALRPLIGTPFES